VSGHNKNRKQSE